MDQPGVRCVQEASPLEHGGGGAQVQPPKPKKVAVRGHIKPILLGVVLGIGASRSSAWEVVR